MIEVGDGAIRMMETILVSGILALSGYVLALLRHNRKVDKSRDIKLDKLVEYHEGIPADDFLGLPAIPGLNERLHRQEEVNKQLTLGQKEIHAMVETGNGTTIGKKVDNIEAIAQNAEQIAKEASNKSDKLHGLVEESLALQEAHLNDGKKIMEIGVVNDEAEWNALRQHGIEMPDYVYPPDDTVFSLEDLRKRKDKES